jgi:calcineurin-like phosphoesterase family protein
MRYYIADCHFFHGVLNTKMDKRGFESVEAMNQYMIDKWNAKVKGTDEVVILGDLSWGTAEETNALLQKLKGRLYLIKGNHDRFLSNNAYDTRRFVWIKDYAEMHDNGRKVVLCHYPVMCYNGQYRRDEKGNPKTYMLYGHVHDTHDEKLMREFRKLTKEAAATGPDGVERNIPCNMINCFCGYSDYTPLTLDEWIETQKNLE